MTTPRVVPYTPILRRYHEVRALHDEPRHRLAQQLAADPGLLADDFAESIALIHAGYNNPDSFHPKHRVPREPTRDGIQNGTDVAWYLCRQGRLPVTDDDDLNADWVEYELSVLGTRGGAVFDRPIHGAVEGDEPAKAGGPLKADLVLVNADHTPVIAEVKVGRDKDPFAALVQLLAYIAHLSTPSQYARLRTHLPEAGYPDSDPARFDGYLLLYGFGESPNTWLEKLMIQAEHLSAGLSQHPAIAAHVGRLACLHLHLGPEDTISATTRWRHDPSQPSEPAVRP